MGLMQIQQWLQTKNKFISFITMKAAVRTSYGNPEIISIQEVAKPIINEDGILIKVHAATVNRTDCCMLWGKPFATRFFSGLFKPRLHVTGTDFAGVIEATGKNVKDFIVGDKIMGFEGLKGCASHAEYMALPGTRRLITMPGNVTFEQAAACIEGAFYAASTIRAFKPKANQKALVYGATGAIGSAMVQILKYYGVYVTAVCRGEHINIVKNQGADKVVDYTTGDFTNDTMQYDFVFDAAGKSSFAKCKRLLKRGGIYTSSDGVENLFLALWTLFFSKKKVRFVIPKNMQDVLIFIRDLVEKGRFKPLMDREYPLEQIAEAFRYVASQQKLGNVILTIY